MALYRKTLGYLNHIGQDDGFWTDDNKIADLFDTDSPLIERLSPYYRLSVLVSKALQAKLDEFDHCEAEINAWDMHLMSNRRTPNTARAGVCSASCAANSPCGSSAGCCSALTNTSPSRWPIGQVLYLDGGLTATQ